MQDHDVYTLNHNRDATVREENRLNDQVSFFYAVSGRKYAPLAIMVSYDIQVSFEVKLMKYGF